MILIKVTTGVKLLNVKQLKFACVQLNGTRDDDLLYTLPFLVLCFKSRTSSISPQAFGAPTQNLTRLVTSWGSWISRDNDDDGCLSFFHHPMDVSSFPTLNSSSGTTGEAGWVKFDGDCKRLGGDGT